MKKNKWCYENKTKSHETIPTLLKNEFKKSSFQSPLIDVTGIQSSGI
jgi:hypothetical protein